MRIHKTKYATWTDEELLKLADQQGFNVSDIGLELMERLQEHIDVTLDAVAQNTQLEQALNNCLDSHADEA